MLNSLLVAFSLLVLLSLPSRPVFAETSAPSEESADQQSQRRQRPRRVLWSPLAARWWPLTRTYAERYKVDPVLVLALMWQESRFRSYAYSRAGAIGLMQLMPQHFRRFGNLRKPRVNIRVGVWYFSRLMRKYGTPELALAAYNRGEPYMDLRLRRRGRRRAIPRSTMTCFVAPILDRWRRYRIYLKSKDLKT